MLRDLPYLIPRVVRRKLFPTDIPRVLSRWLPGFRANAGTKSCARVLGLYHQHLASRLGEAWPRDRRILEVGIGATNSSCYEAVALGAATAIAFEPFVPLDTTLDQELLAECAARHELPEMEIARRVHRVTTLGAVDDHSVDLVLSNSVLEHVGDMDALASDLRKILAPAGAMLHLVDYRDHYFRYPYHHLLWSDEVWSQWLNPGDLPRWRISDHIECFERHGMRVETVRATPLADEFAKVKGRIHPHFARYDPASLAAAFGILWLQSASDATNACAS